MTETRDLDYAGHSDGVSYAKNVDSTVNKLSSMNLGRLTNVAGTNEITGDVSLSTGFTAIGDDAEFSFVAANTNTGAVTINIQSLGLIAVRNASGVALTAGDIQAGKIYKLNYDSTESFWRVTSYLPAVVGAVSKTNYIHSIVFDASGIWTAPYDCFLRIAGVGAGGGGGGERNAGHGKASAGGAGAQSSIEIFVLAGETFTIVVGAAGTGGENNANGIAGGNTTIVSLSGPSNINLFAGGGAGGAFSLSEFATVLGGVGGAATGGDDNFAGGNGGDCTATRQASGGGACGIYQDGFNATTNSNIGSSTPGADLPNYVGGSDPMFDVSGGHYEGGDGNWASTGEVIGENGGIGGGGGGASVFNAGAGVDGIGGDGGPGVVLIHHTGQI